MSYNKSAFEIFSHQKETAEQIVDIYSRFGVKTGEFIGVAEGPRVSRYEFSLSPDTKVSKITMLRDDVSLMLSAPKVRIICPVPDKTAFAVEVPNKTEKFVEFDEVFDAEGIGASANELRVVLGKGFSNEKVCFSLSRAPHLLVGGQSCSGKTTLLKSIICSLILSNSPSELKLLLIAPKKDELEIFEKTKHLLSPVICEDYAAIEALNNLFKECENRIKLFAEYSIRNIDAYNDKARNKLPKIVAFVDEFSYLTAYKGRDFEVVISRLAQIGRMTGVHLVLSTNELTPKNITGIIKANIPTRIALSTKNAMESRAIIDSCDAECLLSKGDMLLCFMMNRPKRIQAAYINDEQIINKQKG